MVLDSGKLVEFGSPKELLRNKTGKLHDLINESFDRDHLYRIAGAV
jgi:ABC-type multidrug transport system fused ATPase/permease subunit